MTNAWRLIGWWCAVGLAGVGGFLPAAWGQEPVGELLGLPADQLPVYVAWEPLPLGLTRTPSEATASPARIALGRQLFFDPLLSGDRTVSCATCHRPEHGFASPQAVPVGIGGKPGKRNAPSLLNRAYGSRQFWDGRAASLEAQALEPIRNPDELGSSVEEVLARLNESAQYRRQFAEAFGGAAAADPLPITAEQLASALAAFERTLLAGNSAADRFRHGEYAALSERQRLGMWLFESRGRCWSCHRGEQLSDEQFHNTGVGFAAADRDVGRAAVSGDDAERFRFKTPGLRGVALTPPYFHDGSAATLEEVVQFYNRGGAPDDPGLDPLLQPLNLTASEVAALADFLRALTPEPANPR